MHSNSGYQRNTRPVRDSRDSEAGAKDIRRQRKEARAMKRYQGEAE